MNQEMPVSFVERHLDEFQSLGVEWIVLTGGEPLMHSDLYGLCEMVRSRGIRITVLTSGLLIERNARRLAESVDDLIVSLDGPAAVHDRIRGVGGGFILIQKGIAALRRERSDFRITARCTVQKENHDALLDTVDAARGLEMNGISFLAADLTSTAFNRPFVWPAARQAEIGLDYGEVPTLSDQIEKIIAANDGFVSDTPAHLRRIVSRFRAHQGLEPFTAPMCNAPWVSAVIETNGDVRPCFFHAPVGNITSDLKSVLNGRNGTAFRDTLDIGQNPVCRRCVCSLRYSPSAG